MHADPNMRTRTLNSLYNSEVAPSSLAFNFKTRNLDTLRENASLLQLVALFVHDLQEFLM